MALKVGAKKEHVESVRNYQSFDQLNGRHPWMETVPEGYVPYAVRELRTGNVAYFNFVLAKEMGLIPADHPSNLTPELKNKILSTFSLQIINEYDERNRRQFPPNTVKPHHYMASRYLQLQHPSRCGKTSGDGRGIWNGVVEYRGQQWDVSSRGTGVTRLAPGAVIAKGPLKTGGRKYGYGCGQAEMDELYAASIFAEIMHLQGFSTERVLCIIDLGRGVGIGVRAAPNLLRPAHLFSLLKQSRRQDLQSAFDYLIQRQVQNKKWKISSSGPRRYGEALALVCSSFANFAARLDVDYIFTWMAWDGDNVLADAGIIDYGSVRQFGIRHDRYRYDDVERFSTTLNEQKSKARLLVQVYAQMVDYIQTGRKAPLRKFDRHPILKQFDQQFRQQRAERILYRLGFNPAQRRSILAQKSLFSKFDKIFSYFETAKVRGSVKRVADGVNHPALFDLKPALRELPEYFLKNNFRRAWMTPETFFRLIRSDFARGKDAKMRPIHIKAINDFQEIYKRMLMAAAGKTDISEVLRGIVERSQIINREDRLTGNALIQIVDEIIRSKKRGTADEEIQKIIDQLILNHTNFPEVEVSAHFRKGPREIAIPHLLEKIMDHILTHRHDI